MGDGLEVAGGPGAGLPFSVPRPGDDSVRDVTSHHGDRTL